MSIITNNIAKTEKYIMVSFYFFSQHFYNTDNERQGYSFSGGGFGRI